MAVKFTTKKFKLQEEYLILCRYRNKLQSVTKKEEENTACVYS